MRKSIVVISIILLIAAAIQAQVINLTPYIGSGLPTTVADSMVTLGSSPVVGLVGTRTVGFQFTVQNAKDSLRVRLDASQDTTLGWINTDGSGRTMKITESGTYGIQTDVADNFRYFRLFFVSRDSTGTKLYNVKVRAGGGR